MLEAPQGVSAAREVTLQRLVIWTFGDSGIHVEALFDPNLVKREMMEMALRQLAYVFEGFTHNPDGKFE